MREKHFHGHTLFVSDVRSTVLSVLGCSIVEDIDVVGIGFQIAGLGGREG